MSIPKQASLISLIPLDTFNVCLVDNLTLNDICTRYTRKACGATVAYRLTKFVHHLKTIHNMSLMDYCRRFLNIEWPKCPIKGTDVGYAIDGKGIHLSTYARGSVDTKSAANQAQYARMREVRRGKGNPMYGKAAWNKGLGLEDPRIEAAANQRRGMKMSEESREKMRLARRLHPLKARHTTPHTDQTKERCRLNTARLWAKGAFNRTSSIHIKMREFLQSLPLKQPFEEEHQVKWFSMDFAFPQIKLAIEVQGSYYHVDPRFYPNGPIDAIQRRNWGRDKAKRITCCDKEGWTIIEAWEPEINNGTFQNDVICKLKQYNLLD